MLPLVSWLFWYICIKDDLEYVQIYWIVTEFLLTMSNMTGDTSRAGYTYPSKAPDVALVFGLVLVAYSLVSCSI